MNDFRITPETWMEDARCTEVSPDIFFPTSETAHRDRAMARKVCGGCEVREACLEYATRTKQSLGIYAGTTPRDRGFRHNGWERTPAGEVA